MRVCVIFGGAVDGLSALLDAVRAHLGVATVDLVWSGDPHLRPPVPAATRWADLGLDEPSGVGWNRLLVAMERPHYRLARGLASAARVAAEGEPVLLLTAGSVGVLESFELPSFDGLAVVARRLDGEVDGRAPGWHDLAAQGRYSPHIIAIAPGGALAALAIARRLCDTEPSRPRASAGAVFTTLVEASRASSTNSSVSGRSARLERDELGDGAGGGTAAASDVVELDGAYVAGWGAAPDHVQLVDTGSLGADEPWLVRIGHREARMRLSERPELARRLIDAAPQWAMADEPLRLPGGIEIDTALANSVALAIERWRRGDGELPPDPFSNTAGLLDWLETAWPPWGPDMGRYWTETWYARPDLIDAFAHPESTDFDGYVDFARHLWHRDGAAPFALGTGHQRLRPAWTSAGTDPDGINLVGYLGFDKSLGDVARRIERSLGAADVPHNNLHYHRSGSPSSAETPPLVERLDYATNLVVVNADQFPNLVHDYRGVLDAGRRTIGYWFWDLEYVPPSMVAAMEYLDELWVATDYSRDAFRAVADRPVETVPIPVPEPVESGATRGDLGMPDDRFVFLVTFDHLSVTERKHPVAAIEAFRQAFPEPLESAGAPVLFVKSINRSQRWSEYERLLIAADERPDIILHDAHLPRADQMALTARADCLVSLHRAEGLGLHLMEAMWFGVPTIATAYSGNMSFQNDRNAALVPYELVPVVDREGYYPPEGEWAEPDRAAAAAAMRRLYDDPAERSRLATEARRTMESQATMADTGRLIERMTQPHPKGPT